MNWHKVYHQWRNGQSPRIDSFSDDDVKVIFDECGNPHFTRYVFAGTAQRLYLKLCRDIGLHV